MAIKKSTKPVRPGRGTPGGPPNPSSAKVSSGVTVLGKIIPGSLAGNRAPLSNATMKELKAMIAKIEADKKAVSSKKDKARMADKKLSTGRGATKYETPASIGSQKKPVIKVTPRGGRGGGGMLGIGSSVTRQPR